MLTDQSVTVAPNVLVDDDQMIRHAWEWVAKKKNISLKTYENADDFLAALNQYNRDTVFFLDYELIGQELTGIALATIIKRQLGSRVYLVTGHPAEMFEEYLTRGIVDGVHGKEFLEPLMARKATHHQPKPTQYEAGLPGIRLTSLLLLAATSTVLLTTACNRAPKQSTEQPVTFQQTEQKPAPVPAPTDSPDWDSVVMHSPSVRADIKKLRAERQSRTRENLYGIEVKPIEGEIPSRFGVQLYRLLGSPIYERDVFVAPKLLVQSAILGGRVASNTAATGRMTLRFPVAVIDGLKSDVSSGISSISLPEEFLIHDQAGLREALTNELGFAPILRAFPACPDNLKIAFGVERLPVRRLLRSEHCPLNQFFEVAVTGTTTQIRALIEKDMLSDHAHLIGDIKLSPHFIKGITNLEFDAGSLRERIYHQFVELPHGLGSGDLLFYPAASVRRGLEAILAGTLTEIGLNESPDFTPLIDDILLNYFEPEACNEADGLCFRPRPEPIVNEPIVYLDVFELESVPNVSLPIPVSTALRGISNDESPFSVGGEQTDDSRPPTRGRRGGLLRPMRDGDLVEFELTEAASFKRQYLAPFLDTAVSRLDNPVCVKWGEPPVREETDYSVCLEWNTACARTKDVCIQEEDYCVWGERECIERGVGLCFFCCNHEDFVCKQTGRRCAKTETQCEEWKPTSCKRFGTKQVPASPAPCLATENQWSRFWRLSELPSIIKNTESPASFDAQALGAGLQIQFTHWEPGVTGQFRQVRISCPLSTFFPTIEQASSHLKIRFRVANNREAGCEPFNAWNRRDGREPELSIVNTLVRAEKYACGFREEFWNGKISYTCPKLGLSSNQPLFDTYYPRFEIRGVLKLPGVRFSSVPGQGRAQPLQISSKRKEQ